MIERRDNGDFSEWNDDPIQIKIRVDHVSEADKLGLDKLIKEYPEFEKVIKRNFKYTPGLQID